MEDLARSGLRLKSMASSRMDAICLIVLCIASTTMCVMGLSCSTGTVANAKYNVKQILMNGSDSSNSPTTLCGVQRSADAISVST